MCIGCNLKDYFNGKCMRFFMSALVSVVGLIIACIGLAGYLPGFNECNSQTLLMTIIALWMDPGKIQSTSHINDKKQKLLGLVAAPDTTIPSNNSSASQSIV